MNTKEARERVIIVGVQTTESDQAFAYSLKELAQLTETAKGEVVAELTQKRPRMDSKTYLGKGKLQELVRLAEETEADVIIFNHGLTPGQTRNIQAEIDLKVIDRVQLILDIFAMRAQSKEGKLQVGLAQLHYLLPRLVVGKVKIFLNWGAELGQEDLVKPNWKQIGAIFGTKLQILNVP